MLVFPAIAFAVALIAIGRGNGKGDDREGEHQLGRESGSSGR